MRLTRITFLEWKHHNVVGGDFVSLWGFSVAVGGFVYLCWLTIQFAQNVELLVDPVQFTQWFGGLLAASWLVNSGARIGRAGVAISDNSLVGKFDKLNMVYWVLYCVYLLDREHELNRINLVFEQFENYHPEFEPHISRSSRYSWGQYDFVVHDLYKESMDQTEYWKVLGAFTRIRAFDIELMSFDYDQGKPSLKGYEQSVEILRKAHRDQENRMVW